MKVSATSTNVYPVFFSSWEKCEQAQRSPYLLARTIRERGYTHIEYSVVGIDRPVLTQRVEDVLILGRTLGQI